MKLKKKWTGSALTWAKLAGVALAATVSWSAHADPIKLRFASFTSDTEQTLVTVFKPFAEESSKDSGGTIQIDMFPNGTLGRNPAQQAQMVADGIADIAWVVPSFSPGRFPESEVFELPGLFNSLGEATQVFTRLAVAGKIESLKSFVTIGTVTTAPYSIHARVPLKTLADLKGRKIRISNSIESQTLSALGAVPVGGVTTTEVAEALARGTVDGTTGHLAPLFDFGQVRVVNSHYFIRLGAVPVLILMNKAKFDSLPK
ncbi:MAG: TRAP transporter substrate-binding protein DctP, partial [Burkholderiaceae bacterium]|nr:TRAP transporter substrate-binding protein DctP [Burkholderiaceae bacterium]